MSHGELRSLSPTAIKVWGSCPARFVASSLNRPPRGKAEAADLGSAVHQALEFFVKGCYLEKTTQPTLKLLLSLYMEAYASYFGEDASMYQDGVDMLKQWFAVTEWEPNREVLSCEVKSTYPLTGIPGHPGITIPFNYIYDRKDKLTYEVYDHETGEMTTVYDIEIVDYKTWRMPRKAEDLDKEIQVRLYAVAAMIEHPDARRIWVTLDQIRYGSIGAVFTRDQCVQAFLFLRKVAADVLDTLTSEEPLPERINDECRYCIRKLECTTLRRHGASGGVLAMSDPDRAALELAEIQNRIKGLASLEAELQMYLLREADERGVPEWTTPDGVKVQLTISKQRGVDPQRVAQIIGAERFAELGKINIGVLDKLLAPASDLTPEQKKKLKALIKPTYGDGKIKVSNPNPFGDD